MLIAAGTLLLAAAGLTTLVSANVAPLHRFDGSTALTLNHYVARHRSQITIWKAITDIGGPTTWRALGALAVVVLFCQKRRRDALLIAAALIGAAGLSGAIKALVGRARPLLPHPVDHAAGGSYPSGHALTSFVAMGLIVIVTRHVLTRPIRRVVVATATSVIVAAVGFSRLMLGVHYPSDVIGGWLIGAAWLAILAAAFQRDGPHRRALTGHV